MSDDLKSARIRATTLGDLLLTAADSYPDEPALMFPEATYTYADLAERAFAHARALHALGIGIGDHVGLLLPTSIQFVDAMFGTALVGATTVPINARFRAPEIAYVAENADLKILITSNAYTDNVDFLGRVRTAFDDLSTEADPMALSLAAAPMLRQVVSLGGSDAPDVVNRASFLALGEGVDDDEIHLKRLQTRLGSTALILYTSGTTANPKGCMITHESQVRNSIAMGRRYGLTQTDKFWSPLPMFHIAGILPLVSIFDVGGCYVTAEYFDPGEALEMLERERVSVTFPCFWTIMGDLIQHPRFATTDLSQMRLMNANFAAQPASVGETMEKALPDIQYVGTFGMTETAGTVCTSRPTDTRDQRFNRLGTPLPGMEIRIIDPETGREVAPGERGECLIRGYSTFTEYYKSPEKTAEALDADRWFHSGDICSLDEDGQVMFHGRLKDMLKVGGENVAAAEIEACLQEHPGVRLAQVVGVPDERYQEVAAAFIEKNGEIEVDEEALIAHCKARVAGFKVPRYVRFVDEWPANATKIQKFKLAERIRSELGLE